MSYAKVENNEIVKYPYRYRDLKRDNPTIGFPKNYLSQAASNGEYNVVEVIEVAAPQEEGSNAEEETPTFNGSVWTQIWKLVVIPSTILPADILGYRGERLKAYGNWVVQLEFITENGLEAWQAKVAEIKAKYPKS